MLPEEVDRLLKHLCYQSGDWGALGPSQGDVGEERVAFERFDNRDYPIVPAHPEVVALGDVMSEDYPRALADSREHR